MQSKFTIFHAFQLLGGLLGLLAGIAFGDIHFGILGVAVGAIVGLFVGMVVGRIPWAVSWALMRRYLRHAASKELRERVGKEYYISHLLIAEIASRGESIEGLREIVVRQLASDSADVRRFGETNAKLWFPGLSSK